MERRRVLALVGSALAGAGCLDRTTPGGRPGTSDSPATDRSPSPTPTPSPTSAPSRTPDPPVTVDPTLVRTAFAATGRCGSSGGADVSVDGDVIVVRGCIRGADGCTVSTLDAVIFDTERDSLTVVVATEDRSDGERACTQAAVHLGYEVRVTFERGLPTVVTVVHDGADGRSAVARFVPGNGTSPTTA